MPAAIRDREQRASKTQLPHCGGKCRAFEKQRRSAVEEGEMRCWGLGTPFGSGTHVVTLAESTVKDNARLFEDISEVPRKAFTMGIRQIMQAKKILILASGADKAAAAKL